MRSFLSLFAMFALWSLKYLVKCRPLQAKGSSFFFGRLLSIEISCREILSCLGSLPFSGVMFTVLFSKSKSVHLSMKASPHLIPVSLSS